MLPLAFVSRMQALLQEDYPAFEAAIGAPLIRRGVRANPLKIRPEELAEQLPLALCPTRFSPLGFETECVFKAGSDPLYHAGAYYMQEPSAMSAVTVLAPQPGERILDLCAAPGSKSTQIAGLLGDTSLLWANEYVPSRARILVQNLERCGVRNVAVSCGETARLAAALPAFFDAVLADVPCSGEGMFRKEPEALTQWSEASIRLCAERGQEILHNAAQCVKPNGRLVLSTCTFAPEENEIAVIRFLKTHPDFSLADCRVSFGRPAFSADRLAPFCTKEEAVAATALPLSYCRRILPQDGGEGHFIALFVRNGESAHPMTAPYRATCPETIAALTRTLLSDCFTEPPHGTLALFGDTVRLLPPALPQTDGVSLLSLGIPVAQVLRSGRTPRVEPCHAVFQSAKQEQCCRVLSLSQQDPRLLAFLRGEEIPAEVENGWCGVSVNGILTGFGKVSNGRLKNRYPKGLRLLG